MVGFCHLTDSHHYHHGQKPTRVGICHGGNMLGNQHHHHHHHHHRHHHHHGEPPTKSPQFTTIIMVTQLIPTMTDSHHGGFLSVMIMVEICQVTKSHHKCWSRNLFGTIPTKMLINMELHLHYQKIFKSYISSHIFSIYRDKIPPLVMAIKLVNMELHQQNDYTKWYSSHIFLTNPNITYD